MNKDIQDKIRSLLAKATDPAASEAEASGAMAMAQKLMDKFHLTEDDLKARGDDAFREVEIDGRMTRKGTAFHPIDKYLAADIAEFCGCMAWKRRKNGDGPDKSMYLGTESDIEFAMYLREAWMRHFDIHWEIYKEDNPRLRDMVSARQQFSIGFADEMKARIDGWKRGNAEDPTSGERNALVVKRQDLVRQEMTRRGIHLRTGKGTRFLGANAAAAGAGVMAAKSAGIGRGVGRGSVRAIAAR